MYVGRFLVVGPGIGAYRVSSRSFPNREIVDRDGTFTVRPTSDAADTDNPYISYNCARFLDSNEPTVPDSALTAIIGNGSHVDPIAEKLALGYPARDGIAESLLALDYERDAYNTPRIAGAIEPTTATIGIVRHDGLLVEAVEEPTMVGTYEVTTPESVDFSASTAENAAKAIHEWSFDHPVCSIGIVSTGESGGFETAIANE